MDTGESSSSSSDEEEWDHVPRRRWNTSHSHHVSGGGELAVPQTITDETVDKFLNKLYEVKDRLGDILVKEKFWERYFDSIAICDRIAAYGVGSFSESKASLYQFCLLLLLIDKLGLKGDQVEFQEPQLRSLDVAVLTRIGIMVNPKRDSERCGLRVLCFMPHCDRVLYEQVLYRLVVERCEFTLLSNLLTSYESEFDTWKQANEHLEEVAMFIWKRDSDRFSAQTESTNMSRFKAKTAQSSEVIPFEAFNDLGIISTKENALEKLLDVLSRFDSVRSKLDSI